ncbi:MAG TPA: hypothetical protein VIY48_21635 [Candidatus Paceibacterota bacterium]
MIILYGNYALSATISTNSGSAAFLTSSTKLFDARSGTVTSFSFSSGGAATSQHTDLNITAVSPLDTTTPWGAVGLVNVQGLPVGTKCVFNGVTQRLVAGERGELSAWWMPSGLNSNAAQAIQIFNDVNGSASIVPGATCGAGEVIVGRALYLPSLVDPTISSTLTDPTAFSRTSGGQLWQCMRKPFRDYAQVLGRFSVSDARGGSASTIQSGAFGGGTIDIQTLRAYLATTPLCAVCDMPHAGFGSRPAAVNGIRYSQSFMQPNWMVCRPTNPGAIVLDQAPWLVWSGLNMEEAT